MDIMNHKIFIQVCELLKASGSSFEEVISPFWSDIQDGVVLPALGKVIPRMAPERHECSWDEAMADAAAAGLTLPSREELQYMYRYLDHINALLVAHGGNCLPRNKSFWSCTEGSQCIAWFVNFGSDYTYYIDKYFKMCSRPLAELKNYNDMNEECKYYKCAPPDDAECCTCVYFNEGDDGEICMLSGEATTCCNKACADYSEQCQEMA